MNLTQVNNGGTFEYNKGYSMLDYYGIPDLNLNTLENLVSEFVYNNMSWKYCENYSPGMYTNCTNDIISDIYVNITK